MIEDYMIAFMLIVVGLLVFDIIMMSTQGYSLTTCLVNNLCSHPYGEQLHITDNIEIDTTVIPPNGKVYIIK